MIPFNISPILHISLTPAGHVVNGYPYLIIVPVLTGMTGGVFPWSFIKAFFLDGEVVNLV